MKIICLHHRLGGYGSHHFNEARGLSDELARRRKELVLLVSVHAQPRVVAELGAHAVLDDPTFRLEWSFEERSRRFVEMLHEHAGQRVRRDDWVLLTIATQLEAHALTRWLQDLPERRKPWIVVLFLSDRWNRGSREEYERQLAEIHQVREAVASLTKDEVRKLLFFAVTELLAEELTELLGTTVKLAPVPLPYGNPPAGADRPRDRPRVAILGGTRREKGSYLIPGIIEACRAATDVEFLIHLTNDNLTPQEAEWLANATPGPHVTVIRDALPLQEYEAALASADIALFPYEVIPYTKRGSGVFGEAVAYGKPVVTTAGTWMARQIESGRAAGVVFADLAPASIAGAIAECVASLDALQESARLLAPEWRRTEGLPLFLDLVESEIAARQSASEPPRPRFWLRWFQ